MHEPHQRLEPGDRYPDPSATVTTAAGGPVEVAEGDEEAEAEKLVHPSSLLTRVTPEQERELHE
ncbi:hypothetical protein B296_00054232, partial [Ensete ventricosum]